MRAKVLIWGLLLLAGDAFAGLGKDAIPTFTMIPATVMTANITGAAMDVRLVDNVDFQYTYTSSAAGSFFVDCTLDNANQVSSPTWTALTLSPAPTATSGGGNGVIELNQSGCSFLRFRYTFTSGTGSLVVKARAKQLGGAGS